MVHLLHNTINQPFISKTKSWVKINDDARRAYNTNCQIKIKLQR